MPFLCQTMASPRREMSCEQKRRRRRPADVEQGCLLNGDTDV